MSEGLHNCPEGLQAVAIGDVVLNDLDARITVAIMEQIIVGNDISSYAEEAQIILNGIKGQIKEIEDD